jgi:RNA polymerase sigma-70 factor (ECF subfamily)
MSASEQNLDEAHAREGWFQTTHWSVVLQAAQRQEGGGAALEKLCQDYWFPLYSYVRRGGRDAEEAKDLTQEFFARLLEKNWLAQADANRGRFRSFLLSALKHFLANEWRKKQAAKRGGGKSVVSLDDTAEALYLAEPASDLTPEKIYERRWALRLFERALGRLREDHQAAGKLAVFEALEPFLSAEAREGDYERVGAALGMSNGAVAGAVHRLRQRYRELVRDEIAQTVTSPAELEDEMRSLLAALG